MEIMGKFNRQAMDQLPRFCIELFISYGVEDSQHICNFILTKRLTYKMAILIEISIFRYSLFRSNIAPARCMVDRIGHK